MLKYQILFLIFIEKEIFCKMRVYQIIPSDESCCIVLHSDNELLKVDIQNIKKRFSKFSYRIYDTDDPFLFDSVLKLRFNILKNAPAPVESHMADVYGLIQNIYVLTHNKCIISGDQNNIWDNL